MATPFIGEIRLAGFSFAPVGWALCNGQVLGIADNTALFSLIGTTYGGDGVTTFQLPNLQSRIPIHQGSNAYGEYAMGQVSGVESVTLTTSEIPAHSHVLNAQSGAGTQSSPAGGLWANSSLNQYSAAAPTAQMDASSLQISSGSQPHNNLPPYVVINYVIALDGIFPSRG
jgi:microcystin-dependent protein